MQHKIKFVLAAFVVFSLFSSVVVAQDSQSDEVKSAEEMQKIAPWTVPAPIVVELFTSEGCASCPPADEILGELTQRQFLLPLSYHVDYWDYLGWKDQFARPEFTERQRAYIQMLRTSVAYTPQMIVAGAMELIGSDRKQIKKVLNDAFTRNNMYGIEIMQRKDGALFARFPEVPIGVPAKIWLIAYTKQMESNVVSGENAGKHLVSYNVVRAIEALGLWKGEALELPLAFDETILESKPDGLAIIANQADFGPIVAAIAFHYPETQ